jgi:hypothetical protein
VAARFVRVVHRRGWDVEEVTAENPAEPSTRNFRSREEALAHARELEPDWIEVGEVVAASEQTPQHHRWTTLRRGSDGKYTASALNWGGATQRNRRAAPDTPSN